jgi:arylsulfatase A-like enzyme
LQDNGYSTFWLGKNHNVPEEDVSSGGSKASQDGLSGAIGNDVRRETNRR